MSDFCVTIRRKSRKERSCPECRVTIWKGQRYVRHAGCTDGDFFDAIQCEACNAFAERYLKSLSIASHLNWDEATYLFGSLIEEAAEHVSFEWESAETMPARRDAIMALFEDWDRQELEYQAREQQRRAEAKRNTERRQQHVQASRWMIRGMSQAGRDAEAGILFQQTIASYPTIIAALATAD